MCLSAVLSERGVFIFYEVYEVGVRSKKKLETSYIELGKARMLQTEIQKRNTKIQKDRKIERQEAERQKDRKK